MTTTLTKSIGWVPTTTKNLTLIDNEVGVTIDGDYQFIFSRIYRNGDNNPNDQVFVTLEVQVDTQDGSGFNSIFTRTSPISSATANDEPAILSFTTPEIISLVAGTKMRLMASAMDGGVDPEDTVLINTDCTINRVGSTA